MSVAGLILSVNPASAQPVTGDVILDNLASSNITAYPSWTAAGTAGPGQLLTMGGQPVDLGSETSLHVYQLVLTDFAYGGEVTLTPPIQFLGGGYQYDDDAQAATITPFQYLAGDINSLLEAVSSVLPTSFTDS